MYPDTNPENFDQYLSQIQKFAFELKVCPREPPCRLPIALGRETLRPAASSPFKHLCRQD
jgi:hypothetical protein